MPSHGAWILVADGEKALLLENIGDGDLPDLRIIQVEAQTLDPNRATRADDEGRRIDNHETGQRSAMERVDYKRLEKERFAEEIVAHLEEARRKKRFAELIVFAPPRVLGALRAAMGKELAATVIKEVDKDFTNAPAETLEKRLLAAL